MLYNSCLTRVDKLNIRCSYSFGVYSRQYMLAQLKGYAILVRRCRKPNDVEYTLEKFAKACYGKRSEVRKLLYSSCGNSDSSYIV